MQYFHPQVILRKELPNGLRYPLVGGVRQRRFDGINLKPRKVPKNAQTPTSRVHAVLGASTECQTRKPERVTLSNSCPVISTAG